MLTNEVLWSDQLYVIFEIDKDATLIEDLNLRYIRPALAIPVDGTYARYVDFVALAAIEYIEYKYSSNNIVRYHPDCV